jgi:hypothetical protein
MHFVVLLSLLLNVPRQLPQSISVNSVAWKVEMTDWDPRGVSGMTDHTHHVIFIARKQSLRDEQDTLLHELMHCVMGPGFSDQRLSGHDAIRDLTPRLLRLMQQNPALTEYLDQS